MKHMRPRRKRLPWWVRLPILIVLVLLGFIAYIHFRQHSMIYHPRPYDQSYADALPKEGVQLEYNILGGNQTAFYIPARTPTPKRLWLAFCGNASLALDWTYSLERFPGNDDAFLLIDYPGYGKSSGYATIDSTRASIAAARQILAERFRVTGDSVSFCAIGHSLGAAVALDFAAHHRFERLVLIAPFTTLREEAAQVVGGPLSHLLMENYDNRTNLRKALRHNPGARVAIVHGTKDEVIPFWMGEQLARTAPGVTFFPVDGGTHVSVLAAAREKIIQWMTQ